MATIKVHGSDAAKLYVTHTSTQDIAKNESAVTLSMYVTPTSGWTIGPWTDNGSYLGDSTSDTFTKSIGEISSKTTLRTVTFTVPHDDDGTKDLTIYWKWGVNSAWGGFVRPKGSFTISLPTIPRTATISSFTGASAYITDPVTVVFNSKHEFTYYLRLSVGGEQIYRDRIGTGVLAAGDHTVTHTFVSSELAKMYNIVTNDIKIPVSAVIETYDGDDKMGESEASTLNLFMPEWVVPTIDSIDISEATPGLAEVFSGYVKTKSTLDISIAASGVHGSTIESYKTVIEGVSYAGSSFISNVLKNSGDIIITTTVTDSRGRTAEHISDPIHVYDYFSPKLTYFSVDRCLSDGTLDDEGTYLKCTYSYSIAPVNHKNTNTVKLQRLNGEDWTDVASFDGYSALTDTYTSTEIFDADTSHTMRLYIADYFSNANIVKQLSTAFTLMNYHESGTSIGFGKVASKENAIQFGLELYDDYDTRITNGLSMYTGTGSSAIDPDTTLEHTILTDKNTPMNGQFMYIVTYFYDGKMVESNRAQYAFPYNTTGSMYHRYFYNGTWSAWRRHVNEDELDEPVEQFEFPVNSVVTTVENVAPSYPGTWELFDKEFAPASYTSVPFTLNTTNCTSAEVYASVAGHNISLKVGIVNKKAIADDTLAMGTISLASIGVANGLPHSFGSYIGAADTNNVWSLWQLSTTGALSSVDCDGNSSSVPAGTKTNWVFFDITMHTIDNMRDDFCNKFYWKRTA